MGEGQGRGGVALKKWGTGVESGLSASLTQASRLHKFLGLVFAQPQGKFDSVLKYVIWQENFFPSLPDTVFGTGGPQEAQSPPLYKMWFRGTVAMEAWPSGEASFSLTFATVMALMLENIVDQPYGLSFLILFRLERP